MFGLLICEDNRDIANDLKTMAEELDFSPVKIVESADQFYLAWATEYVGAIVDIELKGDSGKGLKTWPAIAKLLNRQDPVCKQIFIYSGNISSIRASHEATSVNRLHYIEKMPSLTNLRAKVAAFRELLRSERGGRPLHLIGPSMLDIRTRLPRVAYSSLPVLIVGESGSGKSNLAEEIAKIRSGGESKLVHRINCSAIPESTFESEVFGHKKGAFTGATTDRLGKLLLVSGYEVSSIASATAGIVRNPKRKGVLILDEIATLPLHLQSKLLLVLDGGAIHPMGFDGQGFLPNFSIIAITNQLDDLLSKEKFRPDLRWRLDGWTIKVPPVKEQKENVMAIMDSDAQRPIVFDPDDDKRGWFPVEAKWTPEGKDRVLMECQVIQGGIRAVISLIQRSYIHAHYTRAKSVTLEIVEKAISEKLPDSDDQVTSSSGAMTLICKWFSDNGLDSASVINPRNNNEFVNSLFQQALRNGGKMELFKNAVKKRGALGIVVNDGEFEAILKAKADTIRSWKDKD